MRNRIRAARTIGLRTLLVGAAAAVPLLAVAGPAHAAGTVSNTGGRLAISSTTTNNAITVSVSGSNVRVVNTLTTLSPGGTCTQVNANTVQCPAASVSDMSANLSSGTDLFINNTSLPSLVFLGNGGDIFQGGSNQDLVNAGGGNDRMTGNGGDDTLLGGLGSDTASGGTGTDTCTAETEDTCEK
ncbi:calcium-binding protein [Nonomuraea sp. NPDC050783]|uniref:calcium-binding protein n=1 Tax=Nonomuraea sp. NPDC050783 TaxID=3154634 RepID=UPI003466C8BD